LLCEGASPEEAKRLRKVLTDWCAGDENGFPAQLALLTRAQWRAAASVPRSVTKPGSPPPGVCRAAQTGHGFGQSFEQVTSTNLREQKRLVDKHAADSAKAIAELRVPLSELKRSPSGSR